MYEMYTDEYFERGILETDYYKRGKLKQDEECILKYALPGTKALSIGCGRGRVEGILAERGHDVTSIDLGDFRRIFTYRHIIGNMDSIPDEDFQLIFFCESIEHIDGAEFERNWPRIVAILRRTSGRLIIANWENYHPLVPNGWDHIHLIDDALYDRLSSAADKVVYRKGSHLVLDFKPCNEAKS